MPKKKTLNPMDIIDVQLPSNVVKRLHAMEQVCGALQSDVLRLGRTCEYSKEFGTAKQLTTCKERYQEAVRHLDDALTKHRDFLTEAADKYDRDSSSIIIPGAHGQSN